MTTAVWVTGARGFVGRHLARHLAQRGELVAGIGHGGWPASEAAEWGVCHWINGDVTGDNLHRLRDDVGAPHTIYHLAGGSSVGPSLRIPAEDFRRTVLSVVEVLDWVRRASKSIKVVMPSSAAVYGNAGQGPIDEGIDPTPASPYGFHKRMAELACASYGQAFGVHTVIARLFSVYGSDHRKQLLWDLCNRLESSPKTLRLGGTGAELRDWIHIDDVARLLVALGQDGTPAGTTVNGGTGVATTVRAFAEAVCDAWGLPCELVFSGELRAGDPDSLVAGTALAAELGFVAEERIHDGIRDYVKWYQEMATSRG